MAEELHSLNILNSKSFILMVNLKNGLTNKHLASILIEEVSHDLIDENKYSAFLKFLKREQPLIHLHIMNQSKGTINLSREFHMTNCS